MTTRSMPRREIINDNQTEIPGRVKVVAEFIDVLTLPVTFLAAKEEVQHPGEVSPYTLDLLTVERNKLPLSVAVAELAGNYPVLAIALDKIAAATPFSTILAVTVTMGMQFAENHGALPPSIAENAPNVTPRHELAEEVKQKMETARAESNGATTSHK